MPPHRIASPAKGRRLGWQEECANSLLKSHSGLQRPLGADLFVAPFFLRGWASTNPRFASALLCGGKRAPRSRPRATRLAPKALVESKAGAVDVGAGSSCCRWLSPSHRCLSPFHVSVSSLRSSNRTCGFPASGSPMGFTRSFLSVGIGRDLGAESRDDSVARELSGSARRHLVTPPQKVAHALHDMPF